MHCRAPHNSKATSTLRQYKPFLLHLYLIPVNAVRQMDRQVPASASRFFYYDFLWLERRCRRMGACVMPKMRRRARSR